jgi:hypothetical protein
MPPRVYQMAAQPKVGTAPQEKPRSLSAHVHSGAIWKMGTTIFLRLPGIGVTAIVAATAPQLILLVTRGRAMNPQIMRVLRAYNRTGRALGMLRAGR